MPVPSISLNADWHIYLGSYKEWFKEVTEDIKRELKAGRAILVVFKDQDKLLQFAKEIKMTELKVTHRVTVTVQSIWHKSYHYKCTQFTCTIEEGEMLTHY